MDNFRGQNFCRIFVVFLSFFCRFFVVFLSFFCRFFVKIRGNMVASKKTHDTRREKAAVIDEALAPTPASAFCIGGGVVVDKLTIKQEKFCLEYAESGNATEAYKLAGYKVKSDASAAAGAVQILRNVKVQNRLRELAAQIQSSKIMDVEEMQQLLTTIARGEATDEYITGDGKTIERKVSWKDRTKAIELLGKMQGAFISRQEIDVKGAVPVVIRDDL